MLKEHLKKNNIRNELSVAGDGVEALEMLNSENYSLQESLFWTLICQR
jgi:hypothetical protein